MMDFSNNKFMLNMYGGSEKKRTMIMDGRRYMVKYPDPFRGANGELDFIYNAFSEHIGCHILETMGFEVQRTLLGKVRMRNGEERVAVACEDFAQDGAHLIEFSKLITNDVESDLRIARRSYPMELVMEILDRTKETAGREEIKEQFFDMRVADTVIANTDRHTDNWGFLLEGDKLRFSPIYDCGSSLSSLMSDRQMAEAMKDEEAFKRAEYNQTCPYTVGGKRMFYPEIYGNPPEWLIGAVGRVFPKIDIEAISSVIDSTEGITDMRKEYMKRAVSYRIDRLLKPVYRKSQKNR